MRYLKNYEQHKNSRIFEKIIDTTGTADKATLDYWNGLYDKWIVGKLNEQEKKDYERMSAAKIYYFSEYRDSEGRKKLQDFERKAEIFKTCQAVLNSWQEEFGTKLADATEAEINYFNRKSSTKIDSKYLDAYKEAEAMGTEKLVQKNENFQNEFHKFLDEVEIPWDGIMNDLKVQNIEPKKDTQSSLLGKWWNWFSTKVSDATQSVLDYLFPEKTAVEEEREKHKLLNASSKKYITPNHMKVFLDMLEEVGTNEVKNYIQKNKKKICGENLFKFEDVEISIVKQGVITVNGDKKILLSSGLNPLFNTHKYLFDLSKFDQVYGKKQR